MAILAGLDANLTHEVGRVWRQQDLRGIFYAPGTRLSLHLGKDEKDFLA